MILRRLLPLCLCLATAATALHGEARIERNQILLDTPVLFTGDTATPTPETTVALEQLAAFLKSKPALTRIRIEGHCVSPDTAIAQDLSEKRALTIARRLVELNVDCTRLIAVGFGDTKPVATPAAAPANTRLEIHIAALRNRPIGGLPEDGGGHLAGEICPPKTEPAK